MIRKTLLTLIAAAGLMNAAYAGTQANWYWKQQYDNESPGCKLFTLAVVPGFAQAIQCGDYVRGYWLVQAWAKREAAYMVYYRRHSPELTAMLPRLNKNRAIRGYLQSWEPVYQGLSQP
jgi:hypothetical protein